VLAPAPVQSPAPIQPPAFAGPQGAGTPTGTELPWSGGQPQGDPSRGGEQPGSGQPTATDLPRRGGQPQDSGLPRRGAHSRGTGGPAPWGSEQSAAEPLGPDDRSWFTAHKPSAPPRDREAGFDRDYRLDRDRGSQHEPGPGDLPREQVAPPAQARDFEPARPELAAFRAETPTARPQRLDPPDHQEQPGSTDAGFADPTPTRFDQPPIKDEPRVPDGRPPQAAPDLSPVYQTGMQLVVPPGQEWTFRDPGTGAFQSYQPGTTQAGMTQAGMTQPGISRPGTGQPDGRQPGAFGPGDRSSYEDRSGYGGRSGYDGRPSYDGRASFADQGGFADQVSYPGYGPAAAPYAPGGPAAGPLAQSAERKRGRKVPILIGAGAVVAVVAIGAVVAGPKLLKHADPGCSAYTTSALPAYNHAITDLNAQASQATLTADLTTAISQLSTAMGQAQGAGVKTALQGLLTDLNTVQADVRKGSVPAATVSSLNSASAAADSACS
jgi:hypothetical protein